MELVRMCFVNKWEEQELCVLENNTLMRMFSPRGEEVSGG
jgi:hypothetical protein